MNVFVLTAEWVIDRKKRKKGFIFNVPGTLIDVWKRFWREF